MRSIANSKLSSALIECGVVVMYFWIIGIALLMVDLLIYFIHVIHERLHHALLKVNTT